MTLKKKIFNQIVGKINSPVYGNYFVNLWYFIDATIDDPNFVNESNYEISGHYIKTGNPLLIDTEID